MAQDWQVVFSRVKGALMRRGRSEHEADDLVQEAWMRLAHYQQSQPVAQVEAFMMRAALNLSVDAYRAQARHREELLVEQTLLVQTTPSAEAVAMHRQRLRRLSLGLGRLSDKTRTIFLAHRMEGMSYQAIAQAQGLAVSTVEKHLAKANLLITGWMRGW